MLSLITGPYYLRTVLAAAALHFATVHAQFPGNVTSGDVFSNNLITDLGPFISLFGERVTVQFMGQSMSWADSIMLAMGPIGILTAIVTAIRVCGYRWLRTLIGRAQESSGDGEREIMSTTSESVCELWCPAGIVRVLGEPKIIQCVYNDRHPNRKVMDFHEAIHCGEYIEDSGSKRSGDWSDIEDEIEVLRSEAPNLVLNLSGARSTVRELRIAAIFGVFLQLGVLALFAAGKYKVKFVEGDQPEPTYSFALAVGGTCLVSLGLLLCSYAVERSTVKRTWVAKEAGLRVVWVQLGNHRVNDQLFKAFGLRKGDTQTEFDTIITSRKASRDSRVLTLSASVLTICGFIVQFFGLRGLHYSATLAQLTAMFIMTAVRAWVRRGLSQLPAADQLLAGHELDWLTCHIQKCSGWFVRAGFGEYQPSMTVLTHTEDNEPGNEPVGEGHSYRQEAGDDDDIVWDFIRHALPFFPTWEVETDIPDEELRAIRGIGASLLPVYMIKAFYLFAKRVRIMAIKFVYYYPFITLSLLMRREIEDRETLSAKWKAYLDERDPITMSKIVSNTGSTSDGDRVVERRMELAQLPFGNWRPSISKAASSLSKTMQGTLDFLSKRGFGILVGPDNGWTIRIEAMVVTSVALTNSSVKQVVTVRLGTRSHSA